MNEFDQFVKHELKARCYVRYADDFLMVSHDKNDLKNLLRRIRDFLRNRFHLELHPGKIKLRTLASGVDFLGWVHFPNHRVLQTATKRRMLRRIADGQGKAGTVQSSTGLLAHGNAKKLRRIFEEMTGD